MHTRPCDVSVSSGTPSFSCSTYTLSEDNFIDYDWTGAVDCIYYGVDYGGETNPCSYAPMLAIVSTNATSFPGWFSGPTTVDASLDSAEYCQQLCVDFVADDGTPCSYFSCVAAGAVCARRDR